MQGLKRISVQRPRLANEVHAQILRALQNGSIAPTERLHQERLADMLNVSRTPVREALLRLEQDGILISTSNGGFELRPISERDVADIYKTREAIEGYSAGLLAEKANPELIADLRRLVLAQESLKCANTQEFYDANKTIHRGIVAATGNNYLLEMFDAMWNRALSVQIFGQMKDRHLALSLTGHIELCDAIESHSFSGAFDAMRRHIADGFELQVAALNAR